MEKLAVTDVLNLTTERHIDRYFQLLPKLGSDCVFYCSRTFFDQFPGHAARLKAAGVQTVADGYERALEHKYHLASTHCREPIPRAPELVAMLEKVDARGGKFIYHPVSSEEVYPKAAEFPAGSFILYPFDRTFFDGLGQGKYLIDSTGVPVAGKTDRGVEGMVVGALHLNRDTLALRERGRDELRAEVEGRLGVRFRPDRPLILYMINHYIEASQADLGLARLAKSADIIIKGTSPDFSFPPEEGADECYSRAEGPHIFRTSDSSLNSLMRFAADFNMMSFQSSALITSLMLGLRAIPVCSNRFMGYVPRKPFNSPFLFRDTKQIGVALAWNICPTHIRATELIVEKMDSPEYWAEYERWLPQLRRHHLGRFWLGDEALDRAVAGIRRVLSAGTFAPAEMPDYKVATGAPQLTPPFDFFHECLL